MSSSTGLSGKLLARLTLRNPRGSRIRFVWVALGCFLCAGSAAAQKPQIKDEAGFFSESAVNKAGAISKAIKLLYRRDFRVETFKGVAAEQAAKFGTLTPGEKDRFLESWARARAAALGIDGIYIHVCKNPRRLNVIVDAATDERAFPQAVREKLRDLMLAGFKAKSFDKGLLDGAAFARDRFAQRLAGKSPESPVKPAEFKGGAKVSVHSYKMEKGNTYRLTVTGSGFVPQVQILGLPPGGVGNQSGVVLSPTLPGTNQAAIPGNVAQALFMAKETRVYQVKVDHAPRGDIGKGPHSYTLSIERAVFKPHMALNEPDLEVGEHTRKLDQGKAYGITVTGSGFAPEVQILDGTRPVASAVNGRWFGFGTDAEFISTVSFTPARTADYRIVVGVGPVTQERQAPLTYNVRIVELKMQLSVAAQLTKQDAIYPQRGGPHKVHTVKLEAGKNYQIDMMSRAFDAYLFLEDSGGKVLMQDDDSGGQLNARIIFQPATTDTYRIVATTFNRGAAANATGAYTLTVVENPHMQPRFGAPAFPGKGVADPPK